MYLYVKIKKRNISRNRTLSIALRFNFLNKTVPIADVHKIEMGKNWRCALEK
jgi:hypothetical protein